MTTPGPSLVVLCHGCRGSSPTSGTAFMEFGGATTCYEVLDQAGHRILVDCGTGLPGLGEDGQTFDYSVFLTHLHWDHTQGIPFWAPIYDPGSRLAFYAHRTEDLGTEEALDQVMRPPWFPATFTGTPAAKRFVDLDSEEVRLGALRVRWARLQHPSGVTGYRFERAGGRW